MDPLRTGTISAGMTAAFQTIATLFGASLAASTKTYKNAKLENTGEGLIYVAVMQNETQTPTSADQKSLQPGQVLDFEFFDSRYTYIKLADISVTNKLEFTGTPFFI